MRRITLIAAAFLAIPLVSCAVRTAKVGEEPVDRARRSLDALRAYNASVRTFDGKSLVVYREGDKVLSFRAAIAADKGSERYRLEMFDYVFNKHLVTIVRNGDSLLAVLYFKKTYYELSYDDFRFEEISDIAMPKELILRTMVGEVYIPEGDAGVIGDGDRSLVIEPTNGIRCTVLFNDRDLPEKVVYSDGAESYTVRFLKYKTHDRIDFPDKISVVNGPRSLEINFSDLKLNLPLEDQLFILSGDSLKGLARVS